MTPFRWTVLVVVVLILGVPIVAANLFGWGLWGIGNIFTFLNHLPIPAPPKGAR